MQSGNRSNRSTPQHQRRDQNIRPSASPNSHTGSPKTSDSVFTQHITRDEALKGVESGTMVMGKLIVNPNNHSQAYLKAKNLQPDMYIGGYNMRNRALHNDDVVARIIDRVPMVSPSGAAASSGVMQMRGEVVCVLSRPNDEFVGRIVGNREDQVIKKGDINVLFVPDDGRMQKMVLPISDFSPENYSDVDAGIRGMVVVARFNSWPPNHSYPSGSLVRPIGQTGAIEAETAALLVRHSILQGDFTDKVYADLPKQPWSPEQAEIESRCDLRDLRIFSIDPASCRDMDDAVSVTKFEYNGVPMYEVGVHIADVAHFVPEGSALDSEAFSRGTSVYLVQRVLPMLPRALCDDVCSLCPRVDRYCFSVTACLNERGEIISRDVLPLPVCKSGIIKPGVWFGKAVMKSCGKLSYGHAQQIIDGGDEHALDNVLHDITACGFTARQVADDILTLHKLAQHMRQRRKDAGCISITRAKLAFRLNSTLDPVDTWSYVTKEANFLIEEFMIFANVLVAERLYAYYPSGAVERNHGPPKEEYSKAFVSKMLDVTGQESRDIDISSSLEFREFLRDCQSRLSAVQSMTLSQTASETMVAAMYVSAGDVTKAELHHYGLAVDLYTHFTSPIRRYPDLLVHRQLARTLVNPRTPMSHVPVDLNPIGLDQLPASITDVCAHCNTTKDNAREAGFTSCSVFMNVFLKDRCALQPAVISGMGESSFDVFVPALGLKKRVVCGSIPISQLLSSEGKITFKWDDRQVADSVHGMLSGIVPGKPQPAVCSGALSSSIGLFDCKWVLVSSQMKRAPITTAIWLLPDEYDVKSLYTRTHAGTTHPTTDNVVMMEVIAGTSLGNALITPTDLHANDPHAILQEEIALLDIAS